MLVGGASRAANSETPPIEEKKGHPRPLIAVPRPEEWTEIAGLATKTEVLRYLAAQGRSSYEKIRTWRATYRLTYRGPVSPDLARPPRTPGPTRSAPSGIVCERELLVDFVIDQGRNAIYRDARPLNVAFRDAATGEPLDMPWLSVSAERTVVTPTEHLEFRFWPEVSLAGTQPQEKRKKTPSKLTAYRNPREMVPVWYGGSSDPRKLFGYSGFPIWEDLEMDIAVLSGEHGARMKSHWERNCRLCQAQRPEGTWFQRESVSRTGAGEVLIQRATFSPSQNHLPVEWVILRGARPGDFEKKVQHYMCWTYKQTAGVYVPSRVEEMNCVGLVGNGHEWKYELVSCQLNDLVEPGQFTWAGMDLPEGTVVMDRVDNVAYVWQGGKLNKLSSLAEGANGRGWTRWLRWVLAGLTLAALAAIGLVAWRRRPPRGETPGR